MTVEFDDRFRYLTDWLVDGHTLVVAVTAWVGDSSEQTAMLLDTAGELCVMSGRTAAEVGWKPSFDLEVKKIDTRLGRFQGVVDRIDVSYRGFNDCHLTISCTWLIIEDWPGPTVFGWRGGLERMRWAIEPMDNWFYFGAA